MAQAVSPTVSYNAVSEDELITGEAVALSLRPTPFVLRAAGAAIDLIVYLALLYGLILAAVYGIIPYLPDQGAINPVVILIVVFATVLTPMSVEFAAKGKSLGRLAVGARIVRDDGGAIGLRHSMIRALVGFFEVFMSFGGLAVIVGLVDSRSRRIGDMLAGTYSQYERAARLNEVRIGLPVELIDWARTADVARLPDRLTRRISQFLKSAPRYSPESRIELSVELANEAANYVYPIPDCSAELFLAGVVAMRRDRDARALDTEKRTLESLRPVLSRLPYDFPDR